MLLKFKKSHRWYQILLGPKITSYLRGFTAGSLFSIIFFTKSWSVFFQHLKWSGHCCYMSRKENRISLFCLHLKRSVKVKLLFSAIIKGWHFEVITRIQKVMGGNWNSSKRRAKLKWTPTSSGWVAVIKICCENLKTHMYITYICICILGSSESRSEGFFSWSDFSGSTAILVR